MPQKKITCQHCGHEFTGHNVMVNLSLASGRYDSIHYSSDIWFACKECGAKDMRNFLAETKVKLSDHKITERKKQK